MLKFLADENFNGDVIRGLLLQRASLDLIRVHEVGLRGCDDETILARAADLGRVVLTHDRATMPAYAYDRVNRGQAMPGVLVISDRLPISQVIGELVIVDEIARTDEFDNLVAYLPL